LYLAAEKVGVKQRAVAGQTPFHGGQGGGSVAGADGNPDLGLPRNALCPCGSGRKIKHCRGELTS